jgi:hypothetical protein
MTVALEWEKQFLTGSTQLKFSIKQDQSSRRLVVVISKYST